MRHYTATWVLKHLSKIGTATKPTPFPGKYPTRLLIVGVRRSKKYVFAYAEPFTYFGKPEGTRAKEAIRLYRTGMVRGTLIEFDRKHCVIRWRFDKNEAIVLRNRNVALANSYSPWLLPTGLMQRRAEGTIYTIRGQHGILYSPWTLEETKERVGNVPF